MLRKLNRSEIPVELLELAEKAKRLLEDDEIADWLWRHTRSEGHYGTILEALKLIADDGQFVDWD